MGTAKNQQAIHPDDIMVWADGTMATVEDINRGDYSHMSDDYRPATPQETQEYYE